MSDFELCQSNFVRDYAKVALLTTAHDPDGRMVPLARAHAGKLRELYCGVVVELTTTTAPQLVFALEGIDARVSIMPERQLGIARRAVLELGLRTECNHFHYCDFDRLLHWMHSYPDELYSIVRQIPEYDFLVIGRTARALDTHPEVQAMTEHLSNAIFSAEYGETVDITAASRGISRTAALLILQLSNVDDASVDAEWPFIIQRFSQLKRGYVEVEGLEFETATFFQEEVSKAGGLKQWKRGRSISVGEQGFRNGFLERIAMVTLRFAGQRSKRTEQN